MFFCHVLRHIRCLQIIDESDQYVDVHTKVRVIRKPHLARTGTKALAPLIKGVIERRKAGGKDAAPVREVPSRRGSLLGGNATYATIEDVPNTGPDKAVTTKLVKLKGGGMYRDRCPVAIY